MISYSQIRRYLSRIPNVRRAQEEEPYEWSYTCGRCGETGTEREFAGDTCPSCGYSGKKIYKEKSHHQISSPKIDRAKRYTYQVSGYKVTGENKPNMSTMGKTGEGYKYQKGSIYMLDARATIRIVAVYDSPMGEQTRFVGPPINARIYLQVPDTRWNPKRLQPGTMVTVGIDDAEKLNTQMPPDARKLLTINKDAPSLLRKDGSLDINKYRAKVEEISYRFESIVDEGPDGEPMARITGPYRTSPVTAWYNKKYGTPASPGAEGAKPYPVPGAFKEPQEYSQGVSTYTVPLYMVRGINGMRYPDMDITDGYLYPMDVDAKINEFIRAREVSITNAEKDNVTPPKLRSIPRIPTNTKDAQRIIDDTIKEIAEYYIDLRKEQDNPRYKDLWVDPTTGEDTYNRDIQRIQDREMEERPEHNRERSREIADRQHRQLDQLAMESEEHDMDEIQEKFDKGHAGLNMNQIKHVGRIRMLQSTIADKIIAGGDIGLSTPIRDNIIQRVKDIKDINLLEELASQQQDQIVAYMMRKMGLGSHVRTNLSREQRESIHSFALNGDPDDVQAMESLDDSYEQYEFASMKKRQYQDAVNRFIGSLDNVAARERFKNMPFWQVYQYIKNKDQQ